MALCDIPVVAITPELCKLSVSLHGSLDFVPDHLLNDTEMCTDALRQSLSCLHKIPRDIKPKIDRAVWLIHAKRGLHLKQIPTTMHQDQEIVLASIGANGNGLRAIPEITRTVHQCVIAIRHAGLRVYELIPLAAKGDSELQQAIVDRIERFPWEIGRIPSEERTPAQYRVAATGVLAWHTIARRIEQEPELQAVLVETVQRNPAMFPWIPLSIRFMPVFDGLWDARGAPPMDAFDRSELQQLAADCILPPPTFAVFARFRDCPGTPNFHTLSPADRLAGKLANDDYDEIYPSADRRRFTWRNCPFEVEIGGQPNTWRTLDAKRIWTRLHGLVSVECAQTLRGLIFTHRCPDTKWVLFQFKTEAQATAVRRDLQSRHHSLVIRLNVTSNPEH